VASTSLDRFFRLHSAYPPTNRGVPIDRKGEIVAKAWIKSAATCVAWDGRIWEKGVEGQEVEGGDAEDGDVWAAMQDVGDGDGSDSESDEGRERTRKKKKTR
jgi:hypothetical protein